MLFFGLSSEHPKHPHRHLFFTLSLTPQTLWISDEFPNRLTLKIDGKKFIVVKKICLGFPRLFASDRRIFRLFSCTALMSRPCLLMLTITFVGRISDCIRTQNSSKTTLCRVISRLHNTWASHKTSRMEAGKAQKSWRLTKISSRARKISEHFSSTLSRECLERQELFWLEENTNAKCL